MNENYYSDAYKYSSNHKENLVKDNICGCFYCKNIFSPSQIKKWISDNSQTAICPFCGIDSIIGEHSGYKINYEFLCEMNKLYF